MTDLITIEAINKDLLSKYRVLDGRPIYRLVFSDTQFEKRKGTFRDFFGNEIFIREVTEVREVPKYWYIKPPCWIFEKLIFISGNQALKDISEELPGAENGTYEPIYMFRGKNEQPLPVSERVINFIVWQLHNPTAKLPSDVDAERLLEELEEVGYFEEQIGQDQRSALFSLDNSAFVSTNQLKFKQDKDKT